MNKNSLIILLLLSYSISAIAQNKQVETYDNLEKLIYTHPDSTIGIIDQQRSFIKSKDSLLKYDLIKAKALIYTSQLEAAEKLTDSITETTKNENIKLSANYLKGAFYFYKNDYDGGLAYYRNVLDEAFRLKDTTMIGKVSANLSANFIRQNKYDSALTYLKYSLEIDLKLNDSNYIASDYNYFGICYNKLQLYEQAKTELFKALKYNPDPITKANTQYNIAISYTKLMKMDSALYYGREAEKNFIAYNNQYGLSRLYSVLGTAYQGKSDIKKAIEYFNKTLEIAIASEDSRSQSIAYNNLSTCYFLQNESAKAVDFANKAFMLNLNANNINFAVNSSENLSLAYALSGQVDSSKKYIDVSDSLRDVFLQESYIDKLTAVQGELQLAEKEAKIAKSELEIKAKEATIATQRTQVIATVAIAIVILILLVFGFTQRRNRQKQKFQADLILEKQVGLSREIQASENERKRISKELHDGIGQELSALKMNLGSVIGDLSKENPAYEVRLESISKQLTESADEVRSISHRMMPRALIDGNLTDAIDDLLRKTFQYSDIDYAFDHQSLNYALPKELEISFYRILQELINNIIKHSKANKIEIQLYETAKSVIMHVEDNGVGTKKLKSSGHGMSNIKNRIEMFNGNVNVDSEKNRGTSITVSVPK